MSPNTAFSLHEGPPDAGPLAAPANDAVFAQLSSKSSDVDAPGSNIDNRVVDDDTLKIDFSTAATEGAGDDSVRIEKIVSHGPTSAEPSVPPA